MNATDAIEWLDPTRWTKTGPRERLAILRRIQANIDTYADDLVDTDLAAKGIEPSRRCERAPAGSELPGCRRPDRLQRLGQHRPA